MVTPSLLVIQGEKLRTHRVLLSPQGFRELTVKILTVVHRLVDQSTAMGIVEDDAAPVDFVLQTGHAVPLGESGSEVAEVFRAQVINPPFLSELFDQFLAGLEIVAE